MIGATQMYSGFYFNAANIGPYMTRNNALHTLIAYPIYFIHLCQARWKIEIKKGKATYIAPLQPPTAASIKTWRSSGGAGRVGLSHCKGRHFF